MPREFPKLTHPIIQAPMAGGVSTPELAAAVSSAGGLGFLAGGYQTPDQLQADIARTRDLTSAAFGVNLFVLADAAVDAAALTRYAETISPIAHQQGVEVGEPRFDDDALEAKLAVVCAQRVPVVSFTFGCPTTSVIRRLQNRRIAIWVTVTEVGEAQLATQAGADALIVQGVEAGGHRGTFEDTDGCGEIALLPLMRLIARSSDLPLIASGGIADGAGVAAALAGGARAAQIGTAFMLCPEAATSRAHRDALTRTTPTALTRAFSGRRARGIVNAFMRNYGAEAPSAYPHVHYLTAPLRAVARTTNDAEVINLWAGQAHALAANESAAELVRRWSIDARVALDAAGRHLLSSGQYAPPASETTGR